MTNALQQRISKMRLGAASAGLTLVVVLGLGVVATQSVQAQTFTVLYNFKGSPDGANPYAGLIQDPEGILYGTAWAGGAYGHGSVFRLDPVTRAFGVLHSFAGGTDGANPYAGLSSAGNGNLVGTTYSGGSYGYGTVFQVSPR